MRVSSTSSLRPWLRVALIGSVMLLARPGDAAAQSGDPSETRFDVPQVVEATPVQLGDTAAPQQDAGEMLVTIDLTISVIVQSLSAPPIDQLLIEVRPRGGTAMVVDYAPRTELASEFTGGIEVHETDEVNRSLGLALDACYPPLATGKLTGGAGEKNIASTKYSRAAPMHLIAASGTTRRGRGAYFKFRSTEQQIIEGDRRLSLTLRVPASWRGEMIELLIRGDRQRSGFSVGSLTGSTPRAETLGIGRFLVATYRADDPQGRLLARRLADAEAEMRQRLGSVTELGGNPLSSPAALLRHVSYRIDWNQAGSLQQKAALALHRALDGSLDPHVDREFAALPVDARAICLDYLQARRDYLQITR